jgi:DNA ligase-1
LDGKTLISEPYSKRRKILESIFDHKNLKKVAPDIELIEEKKVDSAEKLKEFFLKQVADGLEGVVVKKIDAPYAAGKRNFNWIKLKRTESGVLHDTIDVVILGYFLGHGKRAKFGIGAMLVGIYNKKKDLFQTIAKIGSGLTDEDWKKWKNEFDKISVSKKPKNVECHKELRPDVWVTPKFVAVVKADEITRSPIHTAAQDDEKEGYALRFPRLVQFRTDKAAYDATTAREIVKIYKEQTRATKATKKK